MKLTGKFQQANICLINSLLTMVYNNKKLYCHFVSKHTTWKVQANQEGFDVTYQHLVYADYVHFMGGNHGQLIRKDCNAAALPEIKKKIKRSI
jgi:hypothetical protein